MRRFARLILMTGGFLLLAAFAFIGLIIADQAWNRGRVGYAILGRDALVAVCRPALEQTLANNRMNPTTLVMADTKRIFKTFGATSIEMALSVRGQDGQMYEGTFFCQTTAERAQVAVRVNRANGAEAPASL